MPRHAAPDNPPRHTTHPPTAPIPPLPRLLLTTPPTDRRGKHAAPDQ